VTVISPRSDAAGNNYSPGAVIHSYIDELNAGRFSVLCSLVEPAAQPSCTKAVAGATSNGAKFTNFKLGYMAIKGDQALVGVTGTNCNPTQKPTCTTNSDPAALFSSGASFATLFRQGLASQNPSDTTNSYSLAPCLK
jgi:hypothetical protein